MTTQPNTAADQLIRHLRKCPTCITAKVFMTRRFCPVRGQLIRATLVERHGEIEEKR